jgi:fluoroquinolone resistance protein
MGINWVTLNRFEDCTFHGCKLNFSNFLGLKLKRLSCISCSLKEVDFSEAQLSEADFSESMLRGAIFTKSDLTKANFRTAKEYFIDPVSTKIKGAKFCLPDALTLIEALGAEVE